MMEITKWDHKRPTFLRCPSERLALNKFCPKRLHFGFEGMNAWLELAVLDQNTGTECRHAKTLDDEYHHKLWFQK